MIRVLMVIVMVAVGIRIIFWLLAPVAPYLLAATDRLHDLSACPLVSRALVVDASRIDAPPPPESTGSALQ